MRMRGQELYDRGLVQPDLREHVVLLLRCSQVIDSLLCPVEFEGHRLFLEILADALPTYPVSETVSESGTL